MNTTRTLTLVLSLGALAQAQTINLRGKVTTSGGQAVPGAIVTLVGQNLKDTTDASGAYAITRTTSSISPSLPQHGNIRLHRGELELQLAAPTSVKIEVFDLSANLVKERTFSQVPAGEFRWNMGENLGASSLLIVRATIGGSVSTFQYSPLHSGKVSVKSSTEASASGASLARSMAGAAVGSLEFKATGYNTKVVDLSSNDSTVNVTLGTVDRWGGLKNPPVKSAGCGKALGVLPRSGTYRISTVPGRGEFIIDIPPNYNKDTPYRLVFGNHCMGASAARVAATDTKGIEMGEDLSGFYSIKTMATRDNVQNIYVAMQGDAGGTWNAPNDLKFWSDVLAHVENNLCVDTTRVFVAGFSFGAMFSYALSLEHPERIRAVATYAPANYNFYQPPNRKIPVAYYQAHGTNDGTCRWVNNDAQKTGAKYCLLQHMQNNGCTSTAADIKLATGSTHVVNEFRGCKDGYPVKFSSFVGGHQAEHADPGSRENWIQRETWEFFKQF